MKRACWYGFYDKKTGNGGVVDNWEEARKQKGKKKKFCCRDDAVHFSQTGETPRRPYHDGRIHVWTDGSGDGRKAGVGVFFEENHELNLGIPLAEHGRPFTNQRAELSAIAHALLQIRMHPEHFVGAGDDVVIHTDSNYSIQCLTVWYKSWLRSDFKENTVKNRDMIEHVLDVLSFTPREVSFEWVQAHAGIYENEQADALARQGASKIIFAQEDNEENR